MKHEWWLCQSTCPLFVEQSQLSAGRRLISSQQSARTRLIISCLVTRPTGGFLNIPKLCLWGIDVKFQGFLT